jgi:hypothetical protein
LLVAPALLGNPPVRIATTASLSRLPRLTLWAWEMPEHLDFIDPQIVAVAYLDQTVYVGQSVAARPRLQPMQVPPGTHVIAVIRIEMRPEAAPTPANEAQAVRESSPCKWTLMPCNRSASSMAAS